MSVSRGPGADTRVRADASAIELPTPGSGPGDRAGAHPVPRRRARRPGRRPGADPGLAGPGPASGTSAPDHLDLPFEGDRDDDTILTRAAEPVLREIADLFATEPVSVILCDADGVVLSRRTGDSALEQHLNRVWLAPGFSYAEQFVGTNGIGTALEARGPAQVFGHEHYVEHLEELACAGAPIRHPVTGQGPRRHRPDVLAARRRAVAGRHRRHAHPAASSAVLLEQSGERELAVLNDYLVACRRNRGPVLARRRRPGDDERPGARAARPRRPGAAAGRGERGTRRGTPAPAARRPAQRPDGAGAHPADGERERDRRRRPRGPGDQLDALPGARGRSSRPLPPLSTAVGSARRGASAAGRWTATCRRGSGWCWRASPGSGRETVARAAHQARTPAARLRVLAAEDAGPDWVAEVAEELASSGGTLVLTDVDRLPGRRSWPRWPRCWSPTASRPTPTGPGSSPRCDRRRGEPARSWPTCCPASRARSSSRRCATTSRTSPSWCPHLLARLGHGSRADLLPGGHAGAHAQPVAGQRRPARRRAAQGRGHAPHRA